MLKRYLISFGVIVLAFTLGAFSTGCEDSEEAPPPQQPQKWSPPREQPQEPQEPAYPREQGGTDSQTEQQDSPAR